MYVSQHDVESLGTARLLQRNAGFYADHLYRTLGRAFVLAGPPERHGPVRLKARFVGEKNDGADQYAPEIALWVEYNPAMGLFTVWGEYRTDKTQSEPTYSSSPRSGYDDEMLQNPARVFDWLNAVAGDVYTDVAASVEGVLRSIHTPAGKVSVVVEQEGCTFCACMEPEFRMPRDYFVSGTQFDGPLGTHYTKGTSAQDWKNDYVDPVRNAVQSTLDNLYGAGAFNVVVDDEGYVFVMGQLDIPPQNFRSSADVNYPNPMQSNLRPLPQTQESKEKSMGKSWFESEILRMAGVDGRERLADRKLVEYYEPGTVIDISDKPKAAPKKAKKQSPAKFGYNVKSGDDLAKFNRLVKELEAEKKAGAKIRNPKALAQWIGLRSAGFKGAAARGAGASESITNRMTSLLGED